MKISRISLVVVFAFYVLTGCGMPSEEGEVSVKTLTKPSPQSTVSMKASSSATVLGITKAPVKAKPGVSRVVISLDQKASYSTSREGRQLIVNVFNARMKSSLKQIEVQDPVIKSIMAKQIGNSVKGVIELVTQDIAYTPSSSADPFQIVLDIWPLSPKTSLPSQAGTKTLSPAPGSVVVETPSQEASGTERSKNLTLNVRKQPLDSMPETALVTQPATAPSNQKIPTQLTWFSEKLSQTLQEREKIKQELLEAEKNFAVKDSMIQVLERKLKEANERIVALEENLIKAKSRTSLAEENEASLQRELQTLLAQLDSASGAHEVPALTSSESGPLTTRSQKIISKISTLQEESKHLQAAEGQIASLKTQISSLIAERDQLQIQHESCQEQVASLKAQTGQVASLREQLRGKDLELDRLRNAIGAAAKLVGGGTAAISLPAPESSTSQVLVTPQPSRSMAPAMTTTSTSQAQPMPQTSSSEPEGTERTQLVLADLIQQQQQMESAMSPDEYVLGPEDVVRIKVVDEENLDKTVTVSSDGFITYPLVGDLRVDGLTTAQLDAQMSSLLGRDFLVNPDVMIEVVKQRSKKVYIMGGVKHPGYHELKGEQRLLGTLLSAGGPTSFQSEARILRLPKQDMSDGSSIETPSPLSVDLNKLFVEGDQSQNILLQDGDVLMISGKSASPADEMGQTVGPNQFYVVGSVVKPGIYTYKEADTVLDAVLRAGGFTEFASRNSTKLVREADGRTKTIRVKMKDVMEKGEMDKNFAIMPGDMIIVPESFF